MAGKTMGTTLYITVARDRAGNLSEACDEQKFKLFLVAHADLKLSTNDWIISHGKCSFLKAESRQQCPLSIATSVSPIVRCAYKLQFAVFPVRGAAVPKHMLTSVG